VEKESFLLGIVCPCIDEMLFIGLFSSWQFFDSEGMHCMCSSLCLLDFVCPAPLRANPDVAYPKHTSFRSSLLAMF
jgi:hypothetical protein